MSDVRQVTARRAEAGAVELRIADGADGSFVFEGEMDLACVGQLRAFFEAHANDRLVLDLSRVTFIDSSGAAELVAGAVGRNGSEGVVVTALHPNVRRVFQILLPDGAPGLDVEG